MKIWVPGAYGMLGGAICRALKVADIQISATRTTDVDITNAEETARHVQAFEPNWIINCAAFTNVDGAETEAQLAKRVNSDGPRHLSQAALTCGAGLVHISTDYVFNGEGTVPYNEQGICAPIGVYAQTKFDGERAIGDALGGTDLPFFIIRTSWLFGAGGKNFVDTITQRMRQDEVVSVVNDQHGRPTYTRDLAAAALRLIAVDAESGTYHFANDGETTWHGLAQACHRLLDNRARCRKIEAVGTDAFPTPAKRPAYSVLATEKYAQATGQQPRPWQEALSDYMAGI